MKRRTAKAFELTGTVVFVLALIVFIAWFMVPRVVGWTPVVVLSGSMEPELGVGAIAMVEGKEPLDVTVGDVVTFTHPAPLKNPAPLVTHRVVAIDHDGSGQPILQTRGDANADDDPWTVPASNVLGTVKFSIPHLGTISNRLRSPLGFTLLVAIPAMYLAWGEVASMAREVRKRKVASGTTTAVIDGDSASQEA